MAEFFFRYFLWQTTGISHVVRDILYSCGIVLVFTEIDWRSFRSVASACLKIFGTWCSLLLFSAMYYMLFGDWRLTLFVYAGIVLGYVILFCRMRISSKITLCACYYMFFFYAVHSIDILYTLWTGSENFNASGTWNWFFEGIRCLLFFIAFVFIQTYLRVCGTEEYEYVNRSGVVVLVSFLVIMVILPDYAEKGSDFQNFITNTLLLLLQLLTYYMFYAATKAHNERLETRMISAHRAAEIEQMHAEYRNHEDIMMLRHEIKNQYAYMKNMLAEKRYDELDKFFSGFEDRALKILEYADCGNFTVNSILNIESGKAKYYGFSIDYKIAVPPKMPIDDADLCSILTNLIDNAIEACHKAQLAPEKANIGIELRLRNKSLFIKVKNSLAENNRQSALALKTTKSDFFRHGYGVRIVKRTVEKYCGCIRYDVKDDVFVADAVLFLDCDREEKI